MYARNTTLLIQISYAHVLPFCSPSYMISSFAAFILMVALMLRVWRLWFLFYAAREKIMHAHHGGGIPWQEVRRIVRSNNRLRVVQNTALSSEIFRYNLLRLHCVKRSEGVHETNLRPGNNTVGFGVRTRTSD